MKLLSDCQTGRENNFDLLRVFFSVCVLVGHSFAIESMPGWPAPFSGILKSTWLGAIGVNGFFLISGFLVAASAVKHDPQTFFINRFLRIFPGLLACLVLTVLVMAFFSSLGYREYFLHPDTVRFFLTNLTLTNMTAHLPGVFEQTVTPIINGSLWTLPVEVRLYILLGMLAAFGVLASRFTATMGLITLAMIGFFNFGDLPTMVPMDAWRNVSVYFLAGALIWFVRDWIQLRWGVAALCLIAFLFFQGKPYYDYLSVVPFCYLVLSLAYLTPPVDLVRRLGDLSYGIYIYAWPVQRILTWSLGPMNPYLHAVYTLCITSVLAFASWRFIEKPALSLRGKLNFQRLRTWWMPRVAKETE